MAAKNSKAKGDVFERKIAKVLGSWWGEKFERVPASGGLRWKKDQRVYGDIIPPEGSSFPWTVECKNREAWNMDALMKGSKEVESWWKQVKRDCEQSGKEPMVIFTRNNQPDYVMMDRDSFGMIEMIHHGIDLDFIKKTVAGDEVVIMRLDDFIERAVRNEQ